MPRRAGVPWGKTLPRETRPAAGCTRTVASTGYRRHCAEGTAMLLKVLGLRNDLGAPMIRMPYGPTACAAAEWAREASAWSSSSLSPAWKVTPGFCRTPWSGIVVGPSISVHCRKPHSVMHNRPVIAVPATGTHHGELVASPGDSRLRHLRQPATAEVPPYPSASASEATRRHHTSPHHQTVTHPTT